MPWCPNGHGEFRDGIAACVDCGARLVAQKPERPVQPAAVDRPGELVGGTSLGTYDRMEVPLILGLLAENGIEGVSDDAGRGPYTRTFSSRLAQVIVPTNQAAEARRLIAKELPDRVEEVVVRAAADPAFGEEVERVQPDRETGPLISFGWLEPEVARIFMELCAQEDIACEPEYPIDSPPPPYAREDGRIRMHVEEWFTDAAANLLETRVRDQLRHRWIQFIEPLRGEDP